MARIPGFSGHVLAPGEDGYEEARRIWNGSIDRRPALIARCGRRDDVIAAVRFARERELLTSIRAGGHGIAGNAICDDGLVIDVSPMTGIDVDPDARLVRVQAGALIGDFYRATQKHGLASPSGIVSHTGVAGLTLGGGIGWLMRRHGLSCDHLVRAEVVTADGGIVAASEDDNPELLWGLRGGGGNFGVVTEFDFRCHAVGPTVLAGPVAYPAERAADVLAAYREFVVDSPRELTTIPTMRKAPPLDWIPEHVHGRPVIMINVCHSGSVEDGERVVAPLRRLADPLFDAIGPRDFTEFNHFFDAGVPHGRAYYWRSRYLRDLTPHAISVFAQSAWEASSPLSYIILFHMGGAIRDVEADAAAFEDRRAEFSPNLNAVAADPAEPNPDVEWVRGLYDRLEPDSTGSEYVNFNPHEGEEQVRAIYGEAKYARLAALKSAYDPDNFFRMNHNVRPAAATTA